MAVAGTLKAIFSADTSQFKAGVASVRSELGKFGSDTAKGKGILGGFKSEMLASRSSIQAFAAATGSTAGELGHMVHAFEMAPGPIGAAIAAIFIMKEAMDDLAESQRKAAEQNARWLDGLKESRMKMEGMKLTPAGERMKESGQRVKEMTQRKNEIIDESRNGYSAIWFALKNFATGGQLGQERINELNDIKSGMRREKENDRQLHGKQELERVGGFNHGGGDFSQQVGQDLGAFRIEHGANEQIQLLQQIAQNTAATGTKTAPESNFQ